MDIYHTHNIRWGLLWILVNPQILTWDLSVTYGLDLKWELSILKHEFGRNAVLVSRSKDSIRTRIDTFILGDYLSSTAISEVFAYAFKLLNLRFISNAQRGLSLTLRNKAVLLPGSFDNSKINPRKVEIGKSKLYSMKYNNSDFPMYLHFNYFRTITLSVSTKASDSNLTMYKPIGTSEVFHRMLETPTSLSPSHSVSIFLPHMS